MNVFNFFNRKNETPVVKFARYTTDDFLILGTSLGQFTLDSACCDFIVNDDHIMFLYSKKDENGRDGNFDLKLNNTAKYKKKNNEIIHEFKQIKKRKTSNS